jgi:hypothetical protein
LLRLLLLDTANPGLTRCWQHEEQDAIALEFFGKMDCSVPKP